MKKLYVGCRVRIVSARPNTINIDYVGHECRIISPAKIKCHYVKDNKVCVHPGTIDGWLVDITVIWRGIENGLCYTSDELEPIIDDSNKVVSWDECDWQPPKELVT